jgi:hypothetical protein
MSKRLWKQKISALLTAMLLVLTGCETVGGLDLNKAVVEAFLSKSSEAKSVVVLDFVPGDTTEEQAMLKLFEHIEIHYDSIKMESDKRISSTGYAVIANRNIPFQTYVTEERIIISIEGGKKPIVIDLAPADSAIVYSAILSQLETKLNDSQLTSSLVSYFVKQLPNPGRTNVESVRETVYGENLPLHKLHSEVTGKELTPLAKTFITNILKDDKALKELIGQIYDLIYPLISPQLDQFIKELKAAKSESSSMPEQDNNRDMSKLLPLIGVLDILKDRDMTIEVVHAQLKELSVILLVALHASDESQLEEQPLLSDKAYVKTDLYFDDTMKLRKLNMTFEAVALEKATNRSLSSVKLAISTELWNVNSPVKAIQMNTNEGALVIEEGLTANDVVRNFAPSSQAYLLLKDDLGLTKKSVTLLMDEGGYKPKSKKPYLEDGVAMVPVSFLSEKLDTRVDWNEATKTVTLTDPMTSVTILLKPGSRTAIVDGEEVNMEKEMILRNDISFVPLTFIVTQLGGTTQWNEDSRSIRVTK